MKQQKDNFSMQAKAYALYRPSYPDELFTFVLSHVTEKKNAWDCGTGNGQLAIKLAGFFDQVMATDLSKKQIAQAVRKENIQYRVMKAEEAAFPGLRFDLITVAQAVHWFDFDKFYQNAKHHLKPKGILALIGYDLIKIDPQCDQIIGNLYAEILGEYWDPERNYIERHYRNLPFPFKEIAAPEYRQKAHWSVEQVTGYLNTWSSVQHYIQKHRQNPVELISRQLHDTWGNAETKEISFPVFLRLGRVQ